MGLMDAGNVESLGEVRYPGNIFLAMRDDNVYPLGADALVVNGGEEPRRLPKASAQLIIFAIHAAALIGGVHVLGL